MVGLRVPGLLVLLTLVGLLLQGEVAFAITGGKTASDPSGLRRHVVRITGPGGEACTGTVVGRDTVVSAAHCFPCSSAARYKVVAMDDHFAATEVAVSSIRVHPGFNRQGLKSNSPLNDIAVIRTAGPLPSYMVPVSLGSGFGGPVTAAGFGSSSWIGTGSLQQVQLAASSTGLTSQGNIILKSPVGAGGACSGDSGGPIFRKAGSGYVLIGVISWSEGGCGAMTAITPVSSYRPFIGR